VIRTTLPRLHDIRENVALLRNLTHGRTLNHLRHDHAFRYAVLHALMIIAEAVRHIPEPVRAPFNHIAWKDIIGLGIIIKHEYHRVDTVIIWDTVTQHVPALAPVIDRLIAQEEPQ